MNTLNKVLVGALVVLGVVAVVSQFRPINVNVTVPDKQTLGASTGPDSFFPRETHDGVPLDFNAPAFYTASSTLCSIKSPPVDSRLEGVNIRFKTLPSYATSYMLGFGTKNATTTSLIAESQMFFAASATNKTVAASSTSFVLIPANSFINLNYSTSTGANVASSGYAPTGTCFARFSEI